MSYASESETMAEMEQKGWYGMPESDEEGTQDVDSHSLARASAEEEDEGLLPNELPSLEENLDRLNRNLVQFIRLTDAHQKRTERVFKEQIQKLGEKTAPYPPHGGMDLNIVVGNAAEALDKSLANVADEIVTAMYRLNRKRPNKFMRFAQKIKREWDNV